MEHNKTSSFTTQKGRNQDAQDHRFRTNLFFVPIQGMSKNQVSDLLSKSKIYIDFETIPEGSPAPRAAMAGCCVITGFKAPRATLKTFNPRIYQIKRQPPDYIKIESLAYDILENFDEHNKHFEEYRTSIRSEPMILNSR